MSVPLAGYREIEHVADWELEVWAPDLPSLLEQAARGMYFLSKTRLMDGPRRTRSLTLRFSDPESLLVKFLGELLYLGEHDGIGFDDFELSIEGGTLQARLSGAPLAMQEKEIKAVTYHNLEIRKGDRGLEARIVFDV